MSRIHILILPGFPRALEKLLRLRFFQRHIWSIPLHQKLFPDANWWMTFGLCAAFVVLFELCVFINATLPWLEGRLANKPNIRVER